MTYKFIPNSDCILRLDDNATIPADPTNRDYAEYLQWVEDGGVTSPAVDPPTLDERKEALKVQATALRWQRETGGITLDGVTVGTTLEDQNRLAGVLASAAIADLDMFDFKAQSGWVTLPIASIQAIAAAIAQHVQQCFTAERNHHEAIDALAEGDIDSYNITEGWPA